MEKREIQSVGQQRELNAIERTSSRQRSATTVANMLELAAAMMGKELLEAEISLWFKTLENYSPNEIEKAFNEYLTKSQFFPKPVDITFLLDRDKTVASEKREAVRAVETTKAEIDRDQKTRDKLKAAGEPYGVDQYHAFIKQALDIVKRIPPPEPGRRGKILARLEEIKRRPNIA